MRSDEPGEPQIPELGAGGGSLSKRLVDQFLSGAHIEAVGEFNTLRSELAIKSPSLIAEALNLLFKKYSNPPVA